MPTPDAREDYSRRSLTIDNLNGWKAIRFFTVANATNGVQACLAAGIPQTNQSHPLTKLLTCTSVRADGVSPNYFEVTATYTQLPSTGPTNDPLKSPPTLKWKVGTKSEKIDHDLYGQVLKNTALVPFKSPGTRDSGTLFLTITRNEPFYDVKKALALQNTVNATVWSPMGLPAVGPGQALCRSIAPTKEYTSSKLQYIPIAYEFEFRQGNNFNPDQPAKPDSDGFYDGFKLVLISQGKSAWYQDPASNSGDVLLGEIVDAQGNKLSEDVLLDGLGVPITPSLAAGGKPYMVQQFEKGKPLSTQPAPKELASETVIVQTIHASDGSESTIIKYWLYNVSDFNTMGFKSTK